MLNVKEILIHIMAKWKILHLVGGDISVWRGMQIMGQMEILPDELFEHHLAAGKFDAAEFMERQFFISVHRLGLRGGIDLLAARNLGKLIKKLEPDMITCWDVPATEQLKLAVVGRRKKIPSVAMIFDRITDRSLLAKLLSNYNSLGLNFVCGSGRLRDWLSGEISEAKRLHHIPPLVSAGLKGISRGVIRRQMGFDSDGILVFIPADGRRDEVFKAIHACGALHTFYPSLRAVIASSDEEFSYRCMRLGADALIENIVRTVDYAESHRLLYASELVIHPAYGFGGESLVLAEAMGASVPIITTGFAEPADMLLPGKTCLHAEPLSPQKIAKVAYQMLGESGLRDRIVKNAENLIEAKYSTSAYRALLIKLFQDLM